MNIWFWALVFAVLWLASRLYFLEDRVRYKLEIEIRKAHGKADATTRKLELLIKTLEQQQKKRLWSVPNER